MIITTKFLKEASICDRLLEQITNKNSDRILSNHLKQQKAVDCTSEGT